MKSLMNRRMMTIPQSFWASPEDAQAESILSPFLMRMVLISFEGCINCDFEAKNYKCIVFQFSEYLSRYGLPTMMGKVIIQVPYF
jgi:hypothetical protein